MTLRPTRPAPAWLSCLLVLPLLAACSHPGASDEQARVAQAFNAWKDAILQQHIGDAMAYIPGQTDLYLATLNVPPSANAAPSAHPGVDHLLRRALAEKVPPDLRARLTLAALLQRINDRHLFNPRDLRAITLGPVTVDGANASAEVYYEGVLTAVQLTFLKENDTWKIDVLALLPYAENLMRLDRALKGESEDHQVDQLVAKLPSL